MEENKKEKKEFESGGVVNGSSNLSAILEKSERIINKGKNNTPEYRLRNDEPMNFVDKDY